MNLLAAVAGWSLQGVLRRATRAAVVALAVSAGRAYGKRLGTALADRSLKSKRRRRRK